MINKRTIGILAHVDAGKTTLSEALLYKAGAIRSWGRVDHGDAFLDTDVREKARGITIFSKQAELLYNDVKIMLLDTPGHVDFCAEAERTLQILDYAILVIGGRDGVQGHTVTLWKLLRQYKIPVFLFINKMDLEGSDRESVLEDLRNKLDERCIDFTPVQSVKWNEQLAMCDESLLEEYLQDESISHDSIQNAIADGKIFPCYFGSALKIEGIEELMDGICRFTKDKEYPAEFAARVYKITRDEQGNRLTHMKITGGALHVKDTLLTGKDDEADAQAEKADQLRIYSGAKFRTTESVCGGDVCAVVGLKKTYAGQGLGTEKETRYAFLEAALLYQIIPAPDHDTHDVLTKLRILEEEDPQLQVIWNEQLQTIQMKLMGRVQQEILENILEEHFGMKIGFGEGRVTYRETISGPVIGAGHFEPLRHYAEVHLLLEPGERGSGLVFDSVCSEDVLDRNWQRLIITHLNEKEHQGVLTGSPITDMKITLINGRAHLKHTEGGDFRQATYRAVRQGLRKADNILLEPWYEFSLRIPVEMIGRAMSDIQKMGGRFNEPQTEGSDTLLTGEAPVSAMKDYAIEVISYTGGRGNLVYGLSGYEPCADQEKIIQEIGYDPDRDIENTADSVFCGHGAGFNVKWDQVDDHLHLDLEVLQYGNPHAADDLFDMNINKAAGGGSTSHYRGTLEEDKELERFFENVPHVQGRTKPKPVIPARVILSEKETDKIKIAPANVKEEYLLVDGYNIIFAWEQLKELAEINMDAARQALIEILSNYQGYRKCRILVVFDAYRVKGGERHNEKHDNIDVIYTKEAETADMYIEKMTHEIGREYHMRVATSDRLEQIIILGNDAFKVSAEEFRLEVEKTNTEISELIKIHNLRNKQQNRNSIKLKERK